MSWPGWNSIEGAGAWGRFWFWFGMVCFFLLGVSEIIAFRYGLRKDVLVAIAEKATKENHTIEVGALRAQLEQTAKQVANDHSLRNRIRALFAVIDPQILRLIDTGGTAFTVRMQPADISELQKLLAEEGGAEFVQVKGMGQHYLNATLTNGTLGPQSPVPDQTEVMIEISKGLANSR